ncbi:unnamed protein product [Gongylonema pulchrum]|uniref:Brix domain-containing protein n=1 Tax=Gongylonema pulchrum TaxID=637853 RepID=A0A183EKP2_9BILA|nr:unnamed protein product [Gongylonema pulchrum]
MIRREARLRREYIYRKSVEATQRALDEKRQLVKKYEMRLMFPNAQRINRGHYDIKKLVQACKANDVTDFILLQETRGNPDTMIVCHLPFGPTAYFTLTNVVMRHEVPDCGTISEEYPHLIFNGLTSRLGRRDFISFRHHTYSKDEHGEIVLKEIGPRFEMRRKFYDFE